MGDSTLTFDEFYAFVKQTYIRNTKLFSKDRLPHSFHMLSNDFFRAWEMKAAKTDVFDRVVTLGGKFAFCFIDGDHSYEATKSDYLKCDSHLIIGGMVLFDDSNDGGAWPGVHRAVAEVVQSKRYEVVLKNPHYLLRKVSAA
jgi:hypothetical protein